jgi:hypothetical protein
MKIIPAKSGVLLAVILLGGILGGSLEGCRSTKKIRKVMATKAPVRTDTVQTPIVQTPEDLHADSLRYIQQALSRLAANKIDFNTFSARIKVRYEGADESPVEVNAFLRIRKDSIIWVSVNAVLGIEAFRMQITPDSVKILDKIKKVARLRSVSFLQEAIHLPVNFGTLQDLLLGNPVFLDTAGIIYYRKENAGALLSLLGVDSLFKSLLTLNAGDYTPQHIQLDDMDPLRARTCAITYGDYDGSDGHHFSTFRKISVSEKAKLDIEIEYKQYKFNEPLSFPFSIPKNYKRK